MSVRPPTKNWTDERPTTKKATAPMRVRVGVGVRVRVRVRVRAGLGLGLGLGLEVRVRVMVRVRVRVTDEGADEHEAEHGAAEGREILRAHTRLLG